jgi:hypothetical protein
MRALLSDCLLIRFSTISAGYGKFNEFQQVKIGVEIGPQLRFLAETQTERRCRPRVEEIGCQSRGDGRLGHSPGHPGGSRISSAEVREVTLGQPVREPGPRASPGADDDARPVRSTRRECECDVRGVGTRRVRATGRGPGRARAGRAGALRVRARGNLSVPGGVVHRPPRGLEAVPAPGRAGGGVGRRLRLRAVRGCAPGLRRPRARGGPSGVPVRDRARHRQGLVRKGGAVLRPQAARARRRQGGAGRAAVPRAGADGDCGAADARRPAGVRPAAGRLRVSGAQVLGVRARLDQPPGLAHQPRADGDGDGDGSALGDDRREARRGGRERRDVPPRRRPAPGRARVSD